MALITCDVSEFQRPLDSSFTRGAIILRGSFGNAKQDSHFLANTAAAKKLWAAGRLPGGAVIYTVYLAGQSVQSQFAFLWRLIGPTVPDWLTGIMIDVEHWGGTSYAISGNHSTQLNQLYGLHAHKMGSWDAVKGYGNAGDLASIWPGRDKRCEVIVANYSSSLAYTKVRGAVGQQYSDGQSKWPVPKIGGKTLPRSSAPFGACDHDVFPTVANAAAFRALWGRPAHGAHPTAKPAPAKPAAAVKPAAKPKPKPVLRYPHANQPAHDHALVAQNRNWALILQNDGTVEIRKNGAHVRNLT